MPDPSLPQITPSQPGIADLLHLPDVRRNLFHRQGAMAAAADTQTVNATKLGAIEAVPAERACELSEFHVIPRPPVLIPCREMG